MKPSISIIIPALDEEKNLAPTIELVIKAIGQRFYDYELLIFDDKSEDRTGEILDRMAKKNSRIRAFHNKKNMNVGYNFRTGIKHATKRYVMLLTAPDSMSMETVENFMAKIGSADIIVSYLVNKKARALYRRIVSYLATITLNLLFGMRMEYFFGMQAYKTDLVRKVRITTNSFGIFPEILIRLVKRGYSYKEIPVASKKIANDSTTAFRIKNMLGVTAVILRLFFVIHFSKRVKVKA